MDFEEIKSFLPRYLSELDQKNLLRELKNFPDNIDKRLYTKLDDNLIYQGDCIDNVIHINLPDINSKEIPVVLLSNTCDMDPANKRDFPIRVNYAPLIKFEKYKNLLESLYSDKTKIYSIINSIKKQYVTYMLFLPKEGKLENDSIVLLDRISSCTIDYIHEKRKERIFSLSDYGFYLFLLKISIHFTRIREDVSRTSQNRKKTFNKLFQ